VFSHSVEDGHGQAVALSLQPRQRRVEARLGVQVAAPERVGRLEPVHVRRQVARGGGGLGRQGHGREGGAVVGVLRAEGAAAAGEGFRAAPRQVVRFGAAVNKQNLQATDAHAKSTHKKDPRKGQKAWRDLRKNRINKQTW
jgi:hypothetical protein